MKTQVSVQRRVRAAELSRGLLQRAARQTLSDEGIVGGDVSVLLTDDAEIHALNQQWRGVDKPTDVLSFPLHDDLDALGDADEGAISLGDVVISLDTARREAVERGVSLDEVVAHLMVHGVLHLLGYDHGAADEEREMRGCEQRTLQRLGYRPVMWDVERE